METKIDKLKAGLRELGFITRDTEDEGWSSFTYMDTTFRFSVDEEQDLLTLGVGYYLEHGNVDRAKILEVINRLNDRVNYLKVIELGVVFWIVYERDVESGMPEVEQIRKMIVLLMGAYFNLTSLYGEIVGLPEDNEDDEEREGSVPDSFDWDRFLKSEKGE